MAGKFTVAVGGIVENSSGEILVLFRSGSDFSNNVWEYPMGRLEQGESCTDGLLREIKEESGLTIEILSILDTAHFYRGEATFENEVIAITFWCKVIGSENIVLSSEHSQYKWVDASKAIELMPNEGMKKVIKKFISMCKN